jgi:hypothetical protein
MLSNHNSIVLSMFCKIHHKICKYHYPNKFHHNRNYINYSGTHHKSYSYCHTLNMSENPCLQKIGLGMFPGTNFKINNYQLHMINNFLCWLKGRFCMLDHTTDRSNPILYSNNPELYNKTGQVS